MKWVPNPGPQTDAYNSLADCLLYGGEPGGGKSQLILGLAFNEHKRSMVMRRKYADLDRIIEDAIKIHGSRDGFRGSPPPRLQISEDQVINFRAAQLLGDEQSTMGQGRDLLGVDEATHFAETQIRFLMGWVRSETPGQRCRTVLATNPPLTAEGLWVNKMFAPWLDPNHPNPAKPGELRWVISDQDGKDLWVNGPEDCREINGKMLRPTSRTYIPAKVSDNPNYAASDYEKTLDAMPEPYRSLLMGGFKTSFKDAERQVIPTQWIMAAQARWKPDGWREYHMTAIAGDPAGGGEDAEEIVARHGPWFSEPKTRQGAETADGGEMAAEIVKIRRNGCPIILDVGGGYAGAVILRLNDNEIPVTRFNGAAKTAEITRDGAKLKLFNKRTVAYWRMREALDPSQEGGSIIALPPSDELRADLAAPTFEFGQNGIQVESKIEIKKRIGRSPGKGDATVMVLAEGDVAVKRALSAQSSGSRGMYANRGHEALKRG